MKPAFFTTNTLWKIALVALGYFLMARVGRIFAIPPGNVTPLWPPAGIALAAVYCWGFRVLPGIVIGTFFSTLSFTLPQLPYVIIANAMIGIGAALQALAGFYLLNKASRSAFPFEQFHDVTVFIFFSGFIAALINSIIGTGSLFLFNFIPASAFPETWLTWWLGDAVGIITFGALIIAWQEKEKQNYNLRGLFEGVLFFFLVSFIYIVMHETRFQLLYLIVLSYIFVIYRSGLQIALLIGTLSTSCLIYAHANGYTVFQGYPVLDPKNGNQTMLLLQLFVASIFIAIQLLYSILAERRNAFLALSKLNRELEERVLERTNSLNEKNIRLKEEVEKSQDLSQQLVTFARQAGMAQVANSVLHNVGNVLNSVNVSVSLLIEKTQKSKLVDLQKVAELIQANLANLGKFLTEDAKGQHLPQYLLVLARCWQEERKNNLEELDKLMLHVEHINKVVKSQSHLSGNTVLKSQHLLAAMCEEAIKLSGVEINHIVVKRDYADLPEMYVDKLKLTQILVNLLVNAKEALKEQESLNKEIGLHFFLADPQTLHIAVMDNGIGIIEQDLPKIFTQGFTTKISGHGVGLHASIIMAKEMQGTIQIKSDGLNQGATFTLVLPYEEQ